MEQKKWECLDNLVKAVKMECEGDPFVKMTPNAIAMLEIQLNLVNLDTILLENEEIQRIYPRKYTRDTLAKYLGYIDYKDFIKRYGTDSEVKSPKPWYIEEEKPMIGNKSDDSPVFVPPPIKDRQKVFLVHGHKDSMKHIVARGLEKIGLEVIILQEQANIGRTIIEKFEIYSKVSHAVVLLSADDWGYSDRDGVEKLKRRAKQNVIFEMGFFIGKLGRENVFILTEVQEGFEMPGDYSGMLYIKYDEGNEWRKNLGREMLEAGLKIDVNALLYL